MARRSVVPLVAVLALASCTDSMSISPVAPIDASAGRLPLATPGSARYLVGFDGTPAVSADVLAASGARIVDSIPSMNVLVVEASNPDALKMAQPRYIEAEFEASVSPIIESTVEGSEAVPGQENTPWVKSKVLWGMRAIHAENAWATTSGGAGVNACIVDTGIDPNHQELAPRVTLRANFVTSPAAETGPTLIDDPNGHGSHVSGTVAATGIVVSGVAPRATLMGARVLNTAGSGSETAIVNGINWCVANGAHVINMSIGGIRYKGTASYISSPITYGNAITAANNAGVVVVVSAGNDNLELPNAIQLVVPAQVAGTIRVGATGPFTRSTAPLAPNWDPFDPNQVWRSVDNKAYYSNYGSIVTVFAPGGRGGVPLSEVNRFVNGVSQPGSINDQIWSVCSSQTAQAGYSNNGGAPAAAGSCSGVLNRYIAYAGTSMAAPHVTGMAAVLYAELGSVRSAANRARVESCITSTTDNIGPSSTYGGGRINVQSALDALRGGRC